MSRPDRTAGCPRDEAALHALHALDDAEHASFEVHLERCATCRAEVDSLRHTAAALAVIQPEVTPSDRLRLRVLGIARPSASPVADLAARAPSGRMAAMDVLRGDEGAFEETGVAGVRMRSLFVDPANDRMTLLVRMEAGAAYPSHRHGGVEECYVIEGDLSGPGFEMRAGDYQRRDAGTVHGTQFTREGCLLFIVSSLHDEMLGARA